MCYIKQGKSATLKPVIRQSGPRDQLFQQRGERVDAKCALWKCPHFLQQTRFPALVQLLFECETGGGVDKIIYWDETGDGEEEGERQRDRERERCFSPSHREPVYQNEQMVDLAGARMAHPQEGTNATTLTLHQSLSPPLSLTPSRSPAPSCCSLSGSRALNASSPPSGRPTGGGILTRRVKTGPTTQREESAASICGCPKDT